jgi:TolA-binding protein
MITPLMTAPALAAWRVVGWFACVGLVVGGAYAWGHHRGYGELKSEWDAQQLRQQKDYADRLSDYAEQLEQLRIETSQRQETYEDRLRTVGRQRDTALAGLRDRAERPAVPASGGAAQACAGASGRELSRPDATFLVGLAARADELRAALERCQGGDVAQDGGRLDR